MKLPPTHILWELIPKDGFDYVKIVEDLANKNQVDLSDCEVRQHNSVIDSFKEEFTSYLLTHGLSSLLNRGLFEEAVVKKGEDQSAIVNWLHIFLDSIEITTELVIVDPYFLASGSDATLIQSALSPILPTLQKITLVTLPNQVNQDVLSTLRSSLSSNANFQINHQTCNDFHDRFWINPLNKKGFLSGTSLNGLGKRYAIIDRLQDSDTEEIIDVLTQENLL